MLRDPSDIPSIPLRLFYSTWASSGASMFTDNLFKPSKNQPGRTMSYLSQQSRSIALYFPLLEGSALQVMAFTIHDKVGKFFTNGRVTIAIRTVCVSHRFDNILFGMRKIAPPQLVPLLTEFSR